LLLLNLYTIRNARKNLALPGELFNLMPSIVNLTKYFRLILEILAPSERTKLVLIFVLALIAAFVEALSIGALFPFMALVSDPEAAYSHPAALWLFELLGSRSREQIVLLGSGLLVVLFTFKNLYLALFYAFQTKFTCGLEARLAADLLSGYLVAPFTERLQRNSTESIRVITGEVGRVSTGVVLALMTLMAEALVIFAILCMLFFAQPKVALVFCVTAGTFGAVVQIVFKRQLDHFRQIRVETGTEMFRSVGESLGALKEIKVLSREQFFYDRFERSSSSYAKSTYVFTTFNLLPRLIFETVAVCAMMAAIMISVVGNLTLPDILPTLTAFGLATMRFLPSIAKIMAGLNSLSYYLPAADTVIREFRSLPAVRDLSMISDSSHGSAVRQAFVSMKFLDVSYRYPGAETFAIRNVNLVITRGETIAIVGRSGSGKSTLADLVLGLLEPSKGSIEINGLGSRICSEQWRGIAGLVAQEPFILDDTVRRNIAFGLRDELIDDTRVWQVLEMAQLDKRIRNTPNGLAAKVGERGALFSGGERQRISIARALYTNPDILVLDEATSALDSETEAEFMGALKSLMGYKTILAITHRPETAAWCDRVITMDNGILVGTS
jgi:ATP-binding cassette, subfamily B, bacterial PglK